MNSINRKKFLQQASMAGVALLLSSVKGFAMMQVSTCDIIDERARQQAAKYNIAHAYPHIDQMLAGPARSVIAMTSIVTPERTVATIIYC